MDWNLWHSRGVFLYEHWWHVWRRRRFQLVATCCVVWWVKAECWQENWLQLILCYFCVYVFQQLYAGSSWWNQPYCINILQYIITNILHWFIQQYTHFFATCLHYSIMTCYLQIRVLLNTTLTFVYTISRIYKSSINNITHHFVIFYYIRQCLIKKIASKFPSFQGITN